MALAVGVRTWLMSRNTNRVRFQLDTKGIHSLPFDEIRVILRAADELIMSGGRSLLVKILKGSRSKDVIARALDRNPAYGYYQEHSAEDVLARVDWLIRNNYLAIEYDGRLPLIVFSDKGWEIEKETYAEELFQNLGQLTSAAAIVDMTFLKDKNRGMILRLLEKIEASGDAAFIPLLEAWAQIDYKKVQARIRSVMSRLAGSGME
jgi:RQC domain